MEYIVDPLQDLCLPGDWETLDALHPNGGGCNCVMQVVCVLDH
jgi:hypothetical protein